MPKHFKIDINDVNNVSRYIYDNNLHNNKWGTSEQVTLIRMYSEGRPYHEISDTLNKSISILTHRLSYIISCYNKSASLDDRIQYTNDDNLEFRCSYYHDCSTCPFPACTEDGYRPNFNIYNSFNKWTKGKWNSEELDTLRRLYKIYSEEVLSNILNRRVDEVHVKLREYKLVPCGAN